MDDLVDKLSPIFNLVPGESYLTKLEKSGITDITSAERNDVVGAFSDGAVDFVVYVEVQPVLIKKWQSFFNVGSAATVTLPLKIIDIKNNKYLYNGKFTEQADNSSILGGVGTKGATMAALDKILVHLNDTLVTRLPIKE
ncbi:MAG: hypothetical protein H6Q67_2102 [Firmicutes bacterium]|nr:hypothetical protein [Bacillota bacterium]